MRLLSRGHGAPHEDSLGGEPPQVRLIVANTIGVGVIEHVHVAATQHEWTGNGVTPHHRHRAPVEGPGSKDVARRVLGEMFDSFNAGEALVRTSTRHHGPIGGDVEVVPDQQVTRVLRSLRSHRSCLFSGTGDGRTLSSGHCWL